MSPKFNDTADYGVTGIALNRLWEISCRFNDGLKITADERRDLAQRMQALLAMTEPLTSMNETELRHLVRDAVTQTKEEAS